jgi:hypothetical protein
MCGATKGGVSTEGLDLTDEAVVQGVVTRDGEPVANAYVRLLDGGGEFTAEVPTSATGSSGSSRPRHLDPAHPGPEGRAGRPHRGRRAR